MYSALLNHSNPTGLHAMLQQKTANNWHRDIQLPLGSAHMTYVPGSTFQALLTPRFLASCNPIRDVYTSFRAARMVKPRGLASAGQPAARCASALASMASHTPRWAPQCLRRNASASTLAHCPQLRPAGRAARAAATAAAAASAPAAAAGSCDTSAATTSSSSPQHPSTPRLRFSSASTASGERGGPAAAAPPLPVTTAAVSSAAQLIVSASMSLMPADIFLAFLLASSALGLPTDADSAGLSSTSIMAAPSAGAVSSAAAPNRSTASSQHSSSSSMDALLAAISLYTMPVGADAAAGAAEKHMAGAGGGGAAEPPPKLIFLKGAAAAPSTAPNIAPGPAARLLGAAQRAKCRDWGAGAQQGMGMAPKSMSCSCCSARLSRPPKWMAPCGTASGTSTRLTPAGSSGSCCSSTPTAAVWRVTRCSAHAARTTAALTSDSAGGSCTALPSARTCSGEVPASSDATQHMPCSTAYSSP
mmetsp:Transcript_18575/g.47023  ORF Transcript_18575/g.47023 Transcript_18575/m.47023 type:complete len:475 (+) Transcript_18575:1108-2532(+)